MRRPSLVLSSVAVAALAGGMAVAAAPASASGSSGSSSPTMTVLASHLNNPRDLTMSSDGNLYVAEAGRAGTNVCAPQGCAGLTGSVDLVHNGGVDRIAECAIPFELLGAAVNQSIQFCVELLEKQQSRDRAPRDGNIVFNRPPPEFESIMWDV